MSVATRWALLSVSVARAALSRVRVAFSCLWVPAGVAYRAGPSGVLWMFAGLFIEWTTAEVSFQMKSSMSWCLSGPLPNDQLWPGATSSSHLRPSRKIITRPHEGGGFIS